jgi:hypothetical protein
MARGGGGALPDLGRLSVTPTGQMVRYDPATSNGHDACAITQEEFEEGEMVWRNSEDGPISALYKPEAIYRWMHTPRPGQEDSGLWEDPITRQQVSYMREANATDGLLRWMSAHNARPIIVHADPSELSKEPMNALIKAFKVFTAERTADQRSYEWMHAVYNGMGTNKFAYEFSIEYKNGERAHIRYETGDVMRNGDGHRPVVYAPGTYYRMVGDGQVIKVYRLTNMPGHLMSILLHLARGARPASRVAAAIKDAEENQRTDLLPELYEKQKRCQPQLAQAQDFIKWFQEFASNIAPGERDILSISAGDAREVEDVSTVELENRAFGGGMEKYSPWDAVWVTPKPLDRRW